MRALTFEVSLDESPESAFFVDALRHVEVLSILEMKADGYLLLCRASRDAVASFRASISRDTANRISVRVVGSKGGLQTLLVSAKWLAGLADLNPKQKRELDFFRAMERVPIYELERPKLQGTKIRISVVAEEGVLKQLLGGLSRLGVPHRIVSLGRPEPRTYALASLTSRQMSVLRLAHAMGYYEIPRRTTTEALARYLDMDKGTVGEHLRRAEKHVFEQIL